MLKLHRLVQNLSAKNVFFYFRTVFVSDSKTFFFGSFVWSVVWIGLKLGRMMSEFDKMVFTQVLAKSPLQGFNQFSPNKIPGISHISSSFRNQYYYACLFSFFSNLNKRSTVWSVSLRLWKRSMSRGLVTSRQTSTKSGQKSRRQKSQPGMLTDNFLRMTEIKEKANVNEVMKRALQSAVKYMQRSPLLHDQGRNYVHKWSHAEFGQLVLRQPRHRFRLSFVRPRSSTPASRIQQHLPVVAEDMELVSCT